MDHHFARQPFRCPTVAGHRRSPSIQSCHLQVQVRIVPASVIADRCLSARRHDLQRAEPRDCPATVISRATALESHATAIRSQITAVGSHPTTIRSRANAPESRSIGATSLHRAGDSLINTNQFPVQLTKFPVSRLQGNRHQAIEIAPTFGAICAAKSAGIAEFPCKFPQNREIPLETRSRRKNCTATHLNEFRIPIDRPSHGIRISRRAPPKCQLIDKSMVT